MSMGDLGLLAASHTPSSMTGTLEKSCLWHSPTVYTTQVQSRAGRIVAPAFWLIVLLAGLVALVVFAGLVALVLEPVEFILDELVLLFCNVGTILGY